jgi:anaerobic dimethyl sulfoxide reductase subunit B
MQYGFYFDQTRCTACQTCVVACKDWHDVPAGPASWMRVTTVEKGIFPSVFVAHIASACYHCANPVCAAACPTHAITKREDNGIVIVHKEACLGKENCGKCLIACPYGAPQFGAESNPRMQKCDLCFDRFADGKKPICVAGCPMRALDAGPISELKKIYGDVNKAIGFTYKAQLKPSIIFKPKEETTIYTH